MELHGQSRVRWSIYIVIIGFKVNLAALGQSLDYNTGQGGIERNHTVSVTKEKTGKVKADYCDDHCREFCKKLRTGHADICVDGSPSNLERDFLPREYQLVILQTCKVPFSAQQRVNPGSASLQISPEMKYGSKENEAVSKPDSEGSHTVQDSAPTVNDNSTRTNPGSTTVLPKRLPTKTGASAIKFGSSRLKSGSNPVKTGSSTVKHSVLSATLQPVISDTETKPSLLKVHSSERDSSTVITHSSVVTPESKTSLTMSVPLTVSDSRPSSMAPDATAANTGSFLVTTSSNEITRPHLITHTPATTTDASVVQGSTAETPTTSSAQKADTSLVKNTAIDGRFKSPVMQTVTTVGNNSSASNSPPQSASQTVPGAREMRSTNVINDSSLIQPLTSSVKRRSFPTKGKISSTQPDDVSQIHQSDSSRKPSSFGNSLPVSRSKGPETHRSDMSASELYPATTMKAGGPFREQALPGQSSDFSIRNIGLSHNKDIPTETPTLASSRSQSNKSLPSHKGKGLHRKAAKKTTPKHLAKKVMQAKTQSSKQMSKQALPNPNLGSSETYPKAGKKSSFGSSLSKEREKTNQFLNFSKSDSSKINRRAKQLPNSARNTEIRQKTKHFPEESKSYRSKIHSKNQNPFSPQRKNEGRAGTDLSSKLSQYASSKILPQTRKKTRRTSSQRRQKDSSTKVKYLSPKSERLTESALNQGRSRKVLSPSLKTIMRSSEKYGGYQTGRAGIRKTGRSSKGISLSSRANSGSKKTNSKKYGAKAIPRNPSSQAKGRQRISKVKDRTDVHQRQYHTAASRYTPSRQNGHFGTGSQITRVGTHKHVETSCSSNRQNGHFGASTGSQITRVGTHKHVKTSRSSNRQNGHFGASTGSQITRVGTHKPVKTSRSSNRQKGPWGNSASKIKRVSFENHIEQQLTGQTGKAAGPRKKFPCSAHKDCEGFSIENHECAHGNKGKRKCRCILGYSRDLQQNRCRMLTECESFADKFHFYRSFELASRPLDRIRGRPSRDECRQACLKSYVCKGANYFKGLLRKKCTTYDTSWYETDFKFRVKRTGMTGFYQRECHIWKN